MGTLSIFKGLSYADFSRIVLASLPSVDEAIARFNGLDGEIQNSAITISDATATEVNLNTIGNRNLRLGSAGTGKVQVYDKTFQVINAIFEPFGVIPMTVDPVNFFTGLITPTPLYLLHMSIATGLPVSAINRMETKNDGFFAQLQMSAGVGGNLNDFSIGCASANVFPGFTLGDNATNFLLWATTSSAQGGKFYIGNTFTLPATRFACLTTNSINGDGLFDSGLIVNNLQGNAAGDDFIAKGSSDATLLVADASANAVGFGTGSPAAKTHAVQSTLGNEVQRLESVASNDDPRESVFQNKVTTTDATTTTIATIAIAASTTVGIEARVTARRTGGTSGTAEDSAFYIISAAYKNVAGTATEVGENVISSFEDQAGWNCTVTPSSANALIQITGAANNNVSWVITYRTYPLST